MVVAVLLGSVRSERMGIRAAKWVITELKKRGHEPVLVDAAELKLPLLDKMWKEIRKDPQPEYAELHAKLLPLAKLYAQADGFCIVSAEYNHSIPPGLSNLIDYFLEEYFFRPSAIVCYSGGQWGGVKAAMQLRAMLAEVGMPSIPSLQPIPRIGVTLSEDGTSLTRDVSRSGKFFDEFEWYMRAFKVEREKGVPY
ncbi:NAD(P)H-dependent oxidoreductase [Edaphobacter sp.]|uniref:NADPH-dependent FMN reductase n=1 Tax=Edaphobacter sp. TaxID=1934404 RepID=UPI002DC016D7|nr:NAD(P)H-dependent oxidoreductase [Edaphobacter sp.]HEU5339877.1 NAD(P)H-dependent oxidoreductase [Edaphobacter sp.]